MGIASRKAASVAAFFVGMTLVAPASVARTVSWIVDCSRGQSISRALEHAPRGIKVTLTVRGTCNESVLIERDDVTLQGDPTTGAVIIAPPAEAGILVRGLRVVIDRMTLERGGIGVYGVSDTYITDTTIRNVAGPGIMLKNAHAFVSGCTVENSGQGVNLLRGSARIKDCQIRSNLGAGITATNASGLNISGTTVASNGLDGIQLDMASEATIDDGNTITSNGFNPIAAGAGVSVAGGSTARISGSAITKNADAGLRLFGKSVAIASDNTIGENGGNGVQAFDSSQASLSNNRIAENGTNSTNGVNFRNGVAVFFSSLTMGGNQVVNHPSTGVRATVSALGIYGNTIVGNAEGVLLFLASQLVMSGDNTVSNNRGFGIWVNGNSTAQISGAKIQFNAGDGILLQWDSKLLLFVDAPTTSGGNGGYGLRCPDTASSIVGLQMLIASPPNAAGDVSPTCTGF